jgi:predicted transcriptional regulator
VEAGRILRQARKRAGLTQRDLAIRAGVAQPVVARIESRGVVPRLDTLDRLLSACGEGLESGPRLGRGLDRSVIRTLLTLTPGERARLAVDEARNLERTGPIAGRK